MQLNLSREQFVEWSKTAKWVDSDNDRDGCDNDWSTSYYKLDDKYFALELLNGRPDKGVFVLKEVWLRETVQFTIYRDFDLAPIFEDYSI